MNVDDLLEKQFRLQGDQKKALKKLGLLTIEDLLYYFPNHYGDTAEVTSIAGVEIKQAVVFFGQVSSLKTSKGFKSKIAMAEAWLQDESGRIKLVWFHQPYIAKMIHEGALVRVEGKVLERKGERYLSNPKIEVMAKLPIGVGDSLFNENKDGGEEHFLYPVYPESQGVTSNWMYHTLQKIFKSGVLETLVDPIPENIREEYKLPTLRTAIIWIHSPKNQDNALSARKRFAFEEVFLIQLKKQQEKQKLLKSGSFTIRPTKEEMEDFIGEYSFKPTAGQQKAIGDVLKDIGSGHPMARLLEGDVGSGKTAVAAAAVYAAANADLQVAYMVPTEILARQHFESFIKYFSHLNVQIGLMTSSGCKKFPSKLNPDGWTTISRAQLLKWLANGDIPILIGTHSLISKAVKFKNLGLAIIDEQHRFGTLQRQKITRKDNLIPHLLSMTATPIPRTLALTAYGDLDISLLEEMPAGRKPVITEIVLTTNRDATYEHIRKELDSGRQAYVICPRIDEPDPTKEAAVNAKSVKEEAIRLKKSVFPHHRIEILHSKMTPSEKEKIMLAFEEHRIDILVSTSVVEVGVNVPNATIIIIEGAERFGLAQLHQLRGRVIRGNHQAYCFIFAESKSQKTVDRLKAFKNAKNGFELAEYDLSLRGAGELYGRKQWGLTDIGMEALRNIKMVEAARNEARRIIEEDLDLKNFPVLREAMLRRKDIHFE